MDSDKDSSQNSELVPIAELVRVALASWKILVATALLTTVVAYMGAGFLPPRYTARMTLVPPQQQGANASQLASLGSLAALVGSAGARTSTDQYMAFMRSETVSDRIIAEFDLMKVYGVSLKYDARLQLSGRVRIASGRRDGLITVEVDDRDPQRAADIANAYAVRLREIVTALAVADAQQRRAFYEDQFNRLRDSFSAQPPAIGLSLAQNEARLESLRAFAREFELARLEESGRSLVIQVVDPASPPEKRSGPRKARLSVGAGFFVAALAYLVLLALHVRRLRSVRSAAA